MSSWCKPRKEKQDGNVLIYLSVIQQEALLNAGDPTAQADPREAALCLPQELTWHPNLINTTTPQPLQFSHHRQESAGRGTRTEPLPRRGGLQFVVEALQAAAGECR